MAGSLKYFRYTTNGGINYAVRMDESNGEAVGNTDLTPADLPIVPRPIGLIPRYALYRSADGLTSRKITITANDVDLGDLPATIDVAAPTIGGGAITLVRQSLVGEIQRSVTAIDTAQLDGDAT